MATHHYVLVCLGVTITVVMLVALLREHGAEQACDSVPCSAEQACDSVPCSAEQACDSVPCSAEQACDSVPCSAEQACDSVPCSAEQACDSVPCSAEQAELSFITSFGNGCYGSLVAPQYVVTTAHCITTNTAFLNLTMGWSDLHGEGGETRSISDYRVHPQWDPNGPKSWAYDQAVVKLDRPVENIKPACLAAAASVFPAGTNATVYCWCKVGTSEDLPAPRTLQAVNVTVNDHAQCKHEYYGNVTDDMICAGNDAGGQNICQGDSGAPLVVKVGDDLILLASSIRGPSECSAPNSPAVYLIHDNTFTTDAIKQMSDSNPVTQCGMRNNAPDVRVENGDVSTPHSFPWMSYVEKPDGYFVGGATLIDESFVVTDFVASPGMFVVLGAHNRSSSAEPIQRIMIEEVFIHPNYTRPNYPYLGMKLVKLSHPVKFTKNIRPICLPKPGYVLPAGSKCLVAGWGDDKKPDLVTDLLREGSVTTITTDQCRRDWADKPYMAKYITNSTICTAADETRPSFKDRGGPLMCEVDDSLIYNLHGVFYWSGWRRYPCLYYDVSVLLSWTNEMLSQFPPGASSKVCFKKFEG